MTLFMVDILLFYCRFLESHWFVWATQISHIPMDINVDRRKDWPSLQVYIYRKRDLRLLGSKFLKIIKKLKLKIIIVIILIIIILKW